jgi:hypothetical protein
MTDDQIEAEIQAKGLTAARVTIESINAAIEYEHYFTAAEGVEMATGDVLADSCTLHRLTFCVLVLHNGYTVTGESACVSPENFDADLGCKIARQNAIDKCWPLFGFALACEQATAEQSTASG